jgi:acid phosphatase type 7
VIITGVYGVLELSLRPDSYDWAFVAEPGKTENDGGQAKCH